MASLAIKDLVPDTVTVHGALDFDRRGDGLSPRRLPAWTRMQVPDMMDVMVRMPSGVRLQFNTPATRVGLTFLGTNTVMPGRERRPISFNLETGDTLLSTSSMLGNQILVDPAKPGEFELIRGNADTVWFDDLPNGDKRCEIWLPQNAFIELRSIEIDDAETLSAPSEDGRRRWIHYGSSISHCVEAEQPALIWPAVAARDAGVSLQNLGFGGQCHLDQFVARTIRDSDADVISIKTGINIINMDSMRERVFGPVVHGFLDTIREGKPDTPIILVSPIYCPSAETHPGPTVPNAEGKFETVRGFEAYRDGCMSLSRAREILAEVVDKRRSAGDSNLMYINGLDIFGEADAGDLPDDLHPNPEGYIRMGHRFADMALSQT